MTWAKIDDRANEHRKQLDAGAEACWLWACGLMYANRQPARDGYIPEKVIGMLYPFAKPAALAASLVKVGLWKKAAGGWKIHEFQKWNQTREQAEAEKEKGRERAAKSYANRKPKKPDSSGEENPKTPPEDEPKETDSSPPRVQTRAGIPSDSAAAATSAATTGSGAAAAPTLAERAQKILNNPYDGEFQQPSQWPEVILAGKCLSYGLEIRFRNSVISDTDLKTVLQIYADGYTAEEVEQLGKLAHASEYFQKKGTWGPAAFTIAVVRRLFSEPVKPVGMQLPKGVVFGAEGL